MDKNLMIVIPIFKVLVSPEEKKYRAIVVIDRQKLRILLENIPKYCGDEVWRNIDSFYLSMSRESSCMVLLLSQSILPKIEEMLRRLKDESVLLAYYIIEPFEKIVPMKNAVFTDENFMKLRIIPQYAFVGIFANLYSLLGDQADFVIERLGYYYGRGYSEYVQKNLFMDKPDVIKILQYSIVTGVTLGLFSLVDIETKLHVISNTTDISVKVRDYYEEEEYSRLGIRKCGLFQQGFYRGIIEYSLGQAKYDVREPICYNEKKESMFLISLPVKISKKEKDEFQKIKNALAIE
jgi:predicted hydrocarbon binding protein